MSGTSGLGRHELVSSFPLSEHQLKRRTDGMAPHPPPRGAHCPADSFVNESDTQALVRELLLREDLM